MKLVFAALVSVSLLSSFTTPHQLAEAETGLRASATTPHGSLTFNCDSVAYAWQRGQQPRLNAKRNVLVLTCPSTDGRAVLSLALSPPADIMQTVRVNVAAAGAPPRYKNVMLPDVSEDAMTVVLTLNGSAPLSYTGPAHLLTGKRYVDLDRAGQSGTFVATLTGGVSVQGNYNFDWATNK